MAVYLPKKLVENFKLLAMQLELGNSEAVEQAIDQWYQHTVAEINKKK